MNVPQTPETPIPETPPTTPAPPPAPPAASADRRRGGGWLPVVAASVLSAALASGVTAALVDDPEPAREPAVAQQPAGRTVEPTAVADGADAAAVAAGRVAPAVVQIQTRTGVGSGVVYDEDGLVLTVAHVVGNNRQVAVRTADGRRVEGEVLGTHEPTDLAVVRIDPDDVLAVADLAGAIGLDGVVATNTTISRVGLVSSPEAIARAGDGGLSGAPLRQRSLEVLRLLRGRLDPATAVVSVGGISTAADAQERLDAGADLLQAYTAFIYEGALWPSRLQRELAAPADDRGRTGSTR